MPIARTNVGLLASFLFLCALSWGAHGASSDQLALTNPGFEQGEAFPGWTVFAGTPDLFELSPEAFSGKYSLRMTDPSAEQAVGLRSEHVPIEPGETYAATVWVRTEGGTAQLYLEFWDAGGTRIDVVFAGASGSTWRAIYLERQAPAEAVTATVLLYGHRTNRGVLYFDEVELMRKHTSPAIDPVARLMREVLIPQAPRWTERPRPSIRLAEGFDYKVHTHPRLYVTQQDLASLEEQIAVGTNPFGINMRQMLSDLEAAAHQVRLQDSFTLSYYGGHTVTYPLPPEQPGPLPNPPSYVAGPYPYWTAMANHLRSRLQTLAGAYLFTGNQVFADVARSDLLSLVEWESWSDPTYPCGGNTCLDTGYIVEGVAFAYDALYNLLTEEERAHIRTALIEKGLKPLYADTASKVDHNIHMVRTAALGIGALLLLGEEPGMEAYLARAYENFFWYLDQRVDTGQTEGMLYTSVSLEHIAKFADALQRVTGDRSLFDHPYIKHVLPYWVLYGQGPRASGLVNFSDSSLASYFYITMLAIARANEFPQANWYIAQAGSSGALASLLYLKPDAKVVPPPPDWPTSRVFADIGWAFLRSGWGPNDALLAFQSSGSRMGHNHFDQNHFVLNVAGEWLIKDNGYQDYNPGPKNDMTSGTLGHNAVLIDGRGQTTKGGGRLVATFLSEALDYVAGDAAAAYAGTDLTGWVRHVLFLKPSQVLLLDEYVLRHNGVQPAWLLHPGGQVVADGRPLQVGFSRVLDQFDIRRGGAGVTARLLWPNDQRVRLLETVGAEEYGPYLQFEPYVADDTLYVATLLDLYTTDRLRLFSGDYDVTSLPIVEDGGRSVLRTQEGLLYRAEEEGDRLELEFSVPVTGTYGLSVAFATSQSYGAVQVELDGTPIGDWIDTYSSRFGETGSLDLGRVELTSGNHTLGLRIVEGNEAARGHFVLLQRLQVVPAGEGAASAMAAHMVSWHELPSGRRIAPVDLNSHRLRLATAQDTGRDLVWITLQAVEEAPEETEGLATDGVVGWAFVDPMDQVRSYAMAGGRTLKVDGHTFVSSEKEINVALTEKERGRWLLELEAAEDSAVTLHIPADSFIIGSLDSAEFVEAGTRTLSLQLQPGKWRTEVVAQHLGEN